MGVQKYMRGHEREYRGQGVREVMVYEGIDWTVDSAIHPANNETTPGICLFPIIIANYLTRLDGTQGVSFVLRVVLYCWQ